MISPVSAVLVHAYHPILGTAATETSPALPATSPFFASSSFSLPHPWAPVCQGYL